MTVLGTHLNKQCSAQRWRMSNTSKVAIYSWQAGMAVRATKSYNDLQSVTRMAIGSFGNACSGICHRNCACETQPHSASMSTDLERAYASADRVDLTTRAIFLDIRTNGGMGASRLFRSSVVVAAKNTPWCDDRTHLRMKQA